MNQPIIRLEIERMKETIMCAISQRHIQYDEYLNSAIDKYCSHNNIQQIIDQQVAKVIDEQIRLNIDSFFRYGEGKKVIADAVVKSLTDSF